MHAAMVMESLTRANNQSRLLDMDQTLSNLLQLNLVQYMSDPSQRKLLMKSMDVNLISFRQIDATGIAHIHTFSDDDSNTVEVSATAFDCLTDTYGQVCRDYGVVFVDETRSNKALGSLHTLAFFQLPDMGLMKLDVVLSRKAVVEVVQWGGDPEKTLESDGTLSPRSSFASFMKGHLKKGKPWDEDDKQRVRRFAEKVEKYTSTEVVAQQKEAIQNLGQEKKDLIQDQKENVSTRYCTIACFLNHLDVKHTNLIACITFSSSFLPSWHMRCAHLFMECWALLKQCEKILHLLTMHCSTRLSCGKFRPFIVCMSALFSYNLIAAQYLTQRQEHASYLG